VDDQTRGVRKAARSGVRGCHSDAQPRLLPTTTRIIGPGFPEPEGEAVFQTAAVKMSVFLAKNKVVLENVESNLTNCKR